MHKTLDGKIKEAVSTAFAIDGQIAELNKQISEIVSDLNREQRSAEAGVLQGARLNLKDSFYRQLGGRLQDMETKREQ